MADKITLIEFHAHTDGSDFSVQPSLGSGVGKLAKTAFRSSSASGESESKGIVESLASSEDEEADEIEYSEEFDEDADEDGEDESDDGGAGKGTGLVGILALIALVLLTKKFLGDDDEDPFEEEFGQ